MNDIKASEDLLLQVLANNIQGIKKALDGGADINYISIYDESALQIAATSDEYYSVAVLLLEKNADINLVNSIGISSLMVACQNGCFEIVKLLLFKGAQVNLQDNYKQSALMYLCGSIELKCKEQGGLYYLSYC